MPSAPGSSAWTESTSTAPRQVGAAWEQALAADGPVVLEFKVDQEVAPLPPQVMKNQAQKAVRAWIKDHERTAIAARGFRQKLAEFYERLPGRDGHWLTARRSARTSRPGTAG
jgi:hypothetical protein